MGEAVTDDEAVDRYVAEILSEAPPLTDWQKARLAELFRAVRLQEPPGTT